MPTVTIKRIIEKDENNKFHAVIKLGEYETEHQAEAMAMMLMMIFQGAVSEGMRLEEKLPTEIIKLR